MPSRTLEEAFEEHPVYLHQQKHLDFASLEELPDTHTWNHLDDQHHNLPTSTSDEKVIPVIDLSDPNALEGIGHACKTWGVFQVINHNVPTRVIDGVENVINCLFSLPMEQKLKATRSPEGVSGYGLARISSFFSKLMWSEGFTIVGSPLDHFRLLWPSNYSGFCDVIEEYEEEMQILAAKLVWLVLGSLGLQNEDINLAGPKGDSKDACAALQLNYYPSCPDPERAMGLAAHTDSTLLTILHQNNTSGLQVLSEGTSSTESTGWVNVPPVSGGLVVNVGDLLHISTNGLYKSVLHRAVVSRTKPRTSIAYLYGPPSSVQISPLPKLVGPTQPPLYRSITWNEYLALKAKHFNKALSTVRISAPLHELVDVNDHI